MVTDKMDKMIAYRSLKELVYDYLSEQITSGVLRPNESINEASICKALEISRTPVREALMQLSHEGYIEHIPRRGFFTRALTEERVRNIYEIIGNLEALAAVKAIERSGSLDLAALRQIIDQMEQAIETRHFVEYQHLQYRFHKMILDASGNDELVQLVEKLKKFFMRQEYIFQSSDVDMQTMFRQMNQEHSHIIDLFETRDKDSLASFLREEHWNVKYAAYHTYI